MKKGDIIALIIFIGIIFLLVFEGTRDKFIAFTGTYKLVGGFLKFFVLATMGDLLSVRVSTGEWKKPSGLIFKAIIWGLIGIVIVLMFTIYSSGVDVLLKENILPFKESKLAHAFFVSLIMNTTFAPTMMAFHRISDSYIDMKAARNENVNLQKVVSSIEWSKFISFVILKTIPFFWIPAHTITFLLPKEYQVLFAAFLGICLGLILGIFKSLNKSNN